MSGDAADGRERGYVAMRLHVLVALETAVARRAELAQVVGDADDVHAAAAALGTAWGLDDAQARAVLELKVGRLAGSERERLRAERERLEARRDELG